MLGEDGLMWEISHVNDMGVLDSSWTEEKSSNCFQEVQNGVGYVDPPEELWSKNLDSAASVFPPSTLTPTIDFDTWGEIYGDLNSWCPEPLQDTSCTMVGDRKGSNCIVQDDELNTPETGVKDTSSAVKEGNGGKRDLKLDLPTPLEIDEMMESILNQDEQFHLVSYVLDDRVPVTTLPAKRSRMSSVNHTGDRYKQQRKRNNESARKSRIKRKSREGDTKKLAEELQRQNESLHIKVEQMEELVKKLRDALLEALGNIKIVSL